MDTLSKAPVSPSGSSNLQEEADLLLALSVDHLPASSQCIDTIKKAQESDLVCSTLVSYCNNHKNNFSVPLLPYWKLRGQLSVHNNLLLYGLHIVKCFMNAIRAYRDATYMPKFQFCGPALVNRLMTPSTSVQHVFVIPGNVKNLLSHQNYRTTHGKKLALTYYISTALLVADYYSRFIEVIKLMTAQLLKLYAQSSTVMAYLRYLYYCYTVHVTIIQH